MIFMNLKLNYQVMDLIFFCFISKIQIYPFPSVASKEFFTYVLTSNNICYSIMEVGHLILLPKNSLFVSFSSWRYKNEIQSNLQKMFRMYNNKGVTCAKTKNNDVCNSLGDFFWG